LRHGAFLCAGLAEALLPMLATWSLPMISASS
jgi:hypothetical protein